MTNLIVYGSLMSERQWSRLVVQRENVSAVMVSGYRRSFCQEPTWRVGNGIQRGVLTVLPKHHTTINAVLIRGVSESALAILDERERGYDRITLPTNQIHSFDDAEPLTTLSDAFIYLGKPEKINPGLAPNTAYLSLCLNAAREWGETFSHVFQQSTFIAEKSLDAIDDAEAC